ncbi:MAG TPA: NADPH-dependent FMN reductase [Solirubrobacteraceae bacterium]|nr:NADPH-dependent FMN reductase [Solirubrobacteraceae bacterium]
MTAHHATYMHGWSAAGGETAPRVLGIGGTTRPGSSTELALLAGLAAARQAGASTYALAAADLELPLYAPHQPTDDPRAAHLLEAVAQADGIMIASPGYHGEISGLVKNALDYLEELSDGPRPYLEGRAVGCIISATGWQGAVTALQSLRTVVHALRGWPTPLGIALNSTEPLFYADGGVQDSAVAARFDLVAEQVVSFARNWSTQP